MRSFLFSLIVVISASLVLQGATPGATPEAAGPTLPDLDPAAPVYLALGDSLAFGVGASDPDTTGYVPVLHGMLPGDDLQLANIAEDGGTTTSMLENQLPLALELLQARNGDTDPANDVTVITIDIGANDAFRPLQDVCAAGISPECAAAIAEVFTTVSGNLGMAIAQLQAAAGPETTIAVMTYPNTLVSCELQQLAPAADLVLEGAPDGSMPGLNDVIRQVAAQFGLPVAETYALIGPDELVGGEDCRHTNDAGHQKLAEAFADVLTGPAATPVALTGVGLLA